jgi:hypothetical protein
LPGTVGVFPQQYPQPLDIKYKRTPAVFGTIQYYLLPYLEQQQLFSHPNLPDANAGGATQSWMTKNIAGGGIVKVFTAPNDPSAGHNGGTSWDRGGPASYHANWHAFGGGWEEDWQIAGKSRIPTTFPDGTSNTIGFIERYANCGQGQNGSPWDQSHTYAERSWQEDGTVGNPICQFHNPNNAYNSPSYWIDPANTGGNGHGGYDNLGQMRADVNYPLNRATNTTPLTPVQVAPAVRDCNPKRLQAFSAGGVQVLLMDGSVRGIRPSTAPITWARLLVPDDGQVIGDDF